MQNHYAVERFVQERHREALAIAEVQALRRRATSARRARRWAGLLRWLRAVSAAAVLHPGEGARMAGSVREP
ncbi:MAG: hypothetical protein QN141_01735 [Armatimonadota bacterium]|nr:hypothetical protein [Armatimonadota bacterium]MDR7450998.1 hypothetical protein [Armatimonadota bacterium]MDR7465981.1 hypothetical protein [Armatimonadota bacterium]MDR7494046.1 hypothetical protein [Armatimonadota bacterium]MDR7498496.1 hypothetical protein [Armatimonadota bacterium]